MITRQEVERRLPLCKSDYIDLVMYLIERYELEVTIRNFMNSSFSFADKDGRTISVVDATTRLNWAYTAKRPTTDAVVFAKGTVVLGWAQVRKLKDFDESVGISIKALNTMPTECRFREQCSHLSTHGGWYDGSNWNCFGCGAELVFNDKQLVPSGRG